MLVEHSSIVSRISTSKAFRSRMASRCRETEGEARSAENAALTVHRIVKPLQSGLHDERVNPDLFDGPTIGLYVSPTKRMYRCDKFLLRQGQLVSRPCARERQRETPTSEIQRLEE